MRVTAVKLLAANHTPLRQFPFKSFMGEQGDTEKWEKIVGGTLTLPSTFDKDVREWLQYIQLTMPPTSPDPIQWTHREYYDSWRIMKEDTGTGPGPSFAAMKSIECDSIANKATSIIALVPLQTGLLPQSWLQAIELLIPKKTSDLRAKKLRRITLFTAQLNHNKKFLGKSMMLYGEQKNLLAIEQYGSRKSKSSIQHAWNKQMVLDWMTTSHTPGVYIANDASGCYDRILLMVAYLILRRHGIPAPAAYFSMVCLQKMKYHVRTAWGTSKDSYGGDSWMTTHGYNPHGIGQGSGDGPGLWAGISSPLFDLLRSNKHGFHIITSITHLSLRMAGFGFVDDTDLLHTLPRKSNISSLVPSAQAALTKWEKLLRITGGALEPTKSHWVYIEQRWQHDKWAFISPPNLSLHVSCPKGHIQSLERLEPGDARLTLGLHQCITGDDVPQYLYMMQSINQWERQLYSSSLSHKDTKLATAITINATLMYPLPATCLTSKHCRKLSTKLLRTALPRMGVVRTASHKWAFGPKSLGGLGLINIRLQQMISHAHLLLTHGCTDTPEGILISSMHELHQLEYGGAKSILDIDPHKTPWVTSTWLWFTLQEAHHYNFQLSAPPLLLHKWRENDQFLMDIFSTLTLSSSQWRILNRTRLYLQVNTLSDVTNDDGRHLRPSAWTGDKAYSLSSQAYIWPRITTPLTSNERKLWRTCLKRTLLVPGTRVLRPLLCIQRWTQDAYKCCQWWQDQQRLVYSVRDGLTFVWGCTSSRRVTRTTLNTYSIEGRSILPPIRCPTQPSFNTDGTIYVTPSFQHPCPTTPQIISHWATQSTFGTFQQRQTLAHQIQHHDAQIMCDGSYRDGYGSSCFVSVKDLQLGGTNIVPGHIDDNSAHRSETGGMLGKVLFVHEICTEHNVTSGSIISGCDCLNVVRKLQHLSTLHIDTSDSSYDLFREIQQALSTSPLQWTFRHIRGHQDRNTPKDKLPPWERANVEADERAKEALATWISDGSPTSSYQPQTWCISTSHEAPRTSNIAKHLLHTISGRQLKEYWIYRLKQDDATITIASVDWTVFSRTMSSASDMIRQFRTKHMAHASSTGVNMLRRRHREDDICPHCGEREDNNHLLQCTSPIVTEACLAFTTKLHLHLQTSGCPALTTFLHDLFFWSRVGLPPTTTHPQLQFILHFQRRLGPSSGQWGMYSPTLVNYLQLQWQQTRRRRNSASCWFSTLSTLQWSFLHDLWMIRNTTLHGPDNHVSRAESDRINQDIINLLEDLSPIPIRLVPPSDRHIFRFTHQSLLSKSLLFRRRWLQKAQTTYTSWLTHRKDPQVQPMLDFLLGATSP